VWGVVKDTGQEKKTEEEEDERNEDTRERERERERERDSSSTPSAPSSFFERTHVHTRNNPLYTGYRMGPTGP